MNLPQDYTERIYAGVLGKIIGVYIGRPFEGWSHEQILTRLGEIKYYVHEQLNQPLIVTDDDISGTFTFLRAMSDYGHTLDLTPAQIGQTWLNYLIEKETVLWWGGMGNSTEHTAYLRLKAGIPAPQSGSMALNGQVVAEQIGAQIFIDGWGMISPGDPELAADLARRAASVSHDGEAIYGAQVIAAMEAQAFVEPNMAKLLEVGVSVIPSDSLIYRLIGDLREWHAKYQSWYECFYRVVANYGYDKYGGNCHMIPNHAVIIMSLLYCDDSFAKSMTIVNTAGWDTDCNSGNVGCLMGIKNGLAGLDDGPDYRTPVADRMYMPTADGGRTVTDAVNETFAVVNVARALAHEEPLQPKNGARFHFDLPGAIQGFVPEPSVEVEGTTLLRNVAGHSALGARSLAIDYQGLADGRAARIVREVLPAFRPTTGYRVHASPTLYPGQIIQARLEADAGNERGVRAGLFVKVLEEGDLPVILRGPAVDLQPGAESLLTWPVQVPVGCPIAWIGVEIMSGQRTQGTVYLDWLTWSGAPEVTFDPPAHEGAAYHGAWVKVCDTFYPKSDHTYRLIQDEGTGMVIQGTREWRDYVVSAKLTPHLARSFGLAARVQGLRRYYALRLTVDGRAQLIRELDGTHILAEEPYAWNLYETIALQIECRGNEIRASVNDMQLFRVEDEAGLDGGAMALLIEEGRLGCDQVRVRPI